MAVADVLAQGGAAAWILPLTLSSGKLNGVGTVQKFQVVGKVGYSFPVGSESTETKYTQINLANGVTMEKDQRSTVIDGSGNAKAGGSSGNVDTVSFDTYENSHTVISALKAIGDNPVLIVFPQGETNADGFGYMVGRFSSEVSVERSGNAAGATSLQFKGKAYEATGSFTHTAINTAITSITQLGTGTILNPSANVVTTSAALASGDIANPGLLAGTIVFKQGS